MKVNASSVSGVDALHLIAEAPARPATSGASGSTERPVVDLSAKTQALRAMDITGPIDDEALISEIRQRLAAGSFDIDYSRVAEAMLAVGFSSAR
jgi:anti-sigma28 factor (negative regulator of flagellin synthesis)